MARTTGAQIVWLVCGVSVTVVRHNRDITAAWLRHNGALFVAGREGGGRLWAGG